MASRAWLHGVGALGDAELLALVLGDGRARAADAPLVVDLLSTAGTGGLSRRGVAELAQARPLGRQRALRLALALELGRRATVERLSQGAQRMNSFEDVARWAGPRLATLDHEEVWLLALDGRQGLRSGQRLAQGGLHGCALLARDVVRAALREAASSIVLVHNHPSGDPTPSVEDVRMTRELGRACDAVGVPLIDHVVVARGGAASLLPYLSATD